MQNERQVAPLIEGDATGMAALDSRDKGILAKALRKGLSRRDATALLMGSGLSMAASLGIFGSASSAMAAVPKKGGSIRAAMTQHGPADTLDPLLFTSSIDFTRGRAHYNGLVQLDDNIVPQPELAEEFSPNAGATEWTFKLRRGVKFHDGSDMTADDVIWSMNRHLGKDSKSKAKVLVANIKEWKKVDGRTVRAIMDSPNADLPAILGTHHFKILKEGVTDFRTPNGTGPYTLQEFKPGIRSIHMRNANYWRSGANLDRLELFAITESTARVNALLAGDVEMISNLNPQAIAAVEGNPALQVWSVPSGSFPCIVCRTDTKPGNSPDFVLALKYLQQRERIMQTILKGQGTVGNDQPINASYPEHCAKIAQRPYDADKAKFHLRKSGVTSAEIQVAEISNGVTDMVLVLQREAAKIGLDLQVKRVPNDGYWGSVWLKTPMFVGDWNMRPTANIMLSLAFGPEAEWNESRWKNERMATLLKDARAATDQSKRLELQCEIQRLVSEESGVIIPVHKNSVDGLSSKVKGMTSDPLGTMGGAEWPEFVWLES